MAPGRLLSTHAGLVMAPPEQVREVLLAVPTGDLSGPDVPLVIAASSATVTGGPDVFTAQVAGVPLTIEVDRTEGWVQARGQWWWCGRFTAAPHAEGTLVTHATYNLATGAVARLVPWTVGRGHRDGGRQALRRVLDDLGSRLNCATRPLPDQA